MLSLKRGVSSLPRTSSSSRIWSTSSTIRRRFYAEDNSSNGSGKNGESLKADNADKEVVDDLLDSPRRAAPDEPPRFNVRLPPSNRIKPAPPVGGMPGPRFEMPQRTARADTDGLMEDIKPAQIGDTEQQPADDAAAKASKAFPKKSKSALSSSIDYYLHVSARSKNCIMTLADENHGTIAKISSGRLGFKNVAEGSYEAGYQCALRMIGKLQEEIERRKEEIRVQVRINGFGQGRSALLKALTMSEGDEVRKNIYKLTDTTPIKIGGVRLQKSRRL